MTKKPRQKKLSKSQIRLVERMLAGECIMKCYDERGEVSYSLQSGRTVSVPTFHSLVNLGVIEAKGDGMFGDSQCFGLAQDGVAA